jgi:hypothetical protein
MNVSEVERFSADMVERPSRCGDDDVHAAPERA